MTMHQASRNIRLLYLFRALNNITLPFAIIVPFFQSIGLNQTQIYITQAAFAATAALCEVPSGYFADRYGRRTSLVTGSVILAITFGIYSLANGFVMMLFVEMLFGIGYALISGADIAMSYDSLAALGRKNEYRRYESRLFGIEHAVAAASFAVGALMATGNLRVPFVAQIAVYTLQAGAAWALWEPPKRIRAVGRNIWADVWRITKYALHGHAEIKWLIIYGAVISTTTHTMVWLVQPYLEELHVPLGAFGVITAASILSIGFFARWADHYERWLGKRGSLVSFTLIATVSYLGLGWRISAFGFLFLLGLNFVRGAYTPIMRDYVNALIDSDIRATVLSVQSLVQRLLYIGAGPLIGFIVDTRGLSNALLFSGLFYGLLGAVTLGMMKRRRLL